MRQNLWLLAAFLMGGQAQAQPLKPALAGLSFLIGDWGSGRGRVADTGGTSTGTSRIVPAAGGAILLRQDHTVLFDSSHHAAGSFDQLMTIYAESGTIHADYFDPAHVIHYMQAAVQPGRSVVFSTAPMPGAPAFSLSYTLSAPDTLAVSFSVLPPHSSVLHEIAAGTLIRTR